MGLKEMSGIFLDSILHGIVSKLWCGVADGEMMRSQRTNDNQNFSTHGHRNLCLKASEDEHGVNFD
jgi:hypothetical protein